MTKVTQHLWFEKDMAAAVQRYTELIPGSRIDWTSAVAADNPSGPAGSVTMAGFTLGDQRYQAIEGGPLSPFNQSFSIAVECDDQAEVDRLWDALSADGGAPIQCGWVRDRYGLSWQIVPRNIGELVTDADPARANRAMQAMLTMDKLDIAALKRAAAGG